MNSLPFAIASHKRAKRQYPPYFLFFLYFLFLFHPFFRSSSNRKIWNVEAIRPGDWIWNRLLLLIRSRCWHHYSGGHISCNLAWLGSTLASRNHKIRIAYLLLYLISTWKFYSVIGCTSLTSNIQVLWKIMNSTSLWIFFPLNKQQGQLQ